MKKFSDSLANQLMLYTVVFTYLLLVGFWLVLYFSLKSRLISQDKEILQDRIKTIATLISGSRFEDLDRRVKKEWFDRSYERSIVRVTDAKGVLVTETPDLTDELKIVLTRLKGDPETAKLELLETPTGSVFHATTARIQPQAGMGYRVQIAVERTSEQRILFEFRSYFSFLLLIAGLCSLWMGRVIVHVALRPVQRVSLVAASVNSETLGERIDPLSFPVELRELAVTMNSMLSRLRDSFDRLGRFSEDMAHELRTPLNNLLGSMSMTLAKDRELADYKSQLESGVEECERLKRIIDSLLFIARAADPGLMLNRRRLCLADELRNIVSFYEASAEEKGVRIELSAEESVPLYSDRTLFQRCVGNILSNSIRYSRPESEISIKTSHQDRWIRIEIADAGCGIPDTALAHLGERFFRVDPARTKVEGGTGLGLSIVKSIVHVHGGKMDVSSTMGQGTTVTLQFPDLS